MQHKRVKFNRCKQEDDETVEDLIADWRSTVATGPYRTN